MFKILSTLNSVTFFTSNFLIFLLASCISFSDEKDKEIREFSARMISDKNKLMVVYKDLIIVREYISKKHRTLTKEEMDAITKKELENKRKKMTEEDRKVKNKIRKKVLAKIKREELQTGQDLSLYYNNKKYIQKVVDKKFWQYKGEDPDAMRGSTVYDENGQILLEDGWFEYYKPEDGCYDLFNASRVCVSGGMLVSAQISKDVFLPADEFYQSYDSEAKELKFIYVYNKYILGHKFPYHLLQIKSKGYPGFVYLYIFDIEDALSYKDIVEHVVGFKKDIVKSSIYKKLNHKSNNLVAIIGDGFKDVSCPSHKFFKIVPFGGAVLYDMYFEGYVLIEPVDPLDADENDLLVKILNTHVSTYRPEIVSDNGYHIA